jgi:hypothetical protein
LHFDDGKKNYEIQQTTQPGEQVSGSSPLVGSSLLSLNLLLFLIPR